MYAQPLVSIITINYNESAVTLELLASLRCLTYPAVEVIVVDNASPNDQPGRIKEAYPEVHLIKSPENLGFAGGNNLGIEAAKGAFLFFLNNDTEVPPGVLEPLVETLQRQPEVGIVSPKIKVVTVEDPVEYHLDGINQIQVQPKIGMTFARGLRAILRHDPDVVMIGEIRDLETAEAAIQAALTGHLVFSTLHTNDAASAATRLLDMGVEPYLVTSTLLAAMAQRLVRRICPDCKRPVEPDRERLPADLELAPGQMLYRGEGCRACRGTGYRGRTGLFELMRITDPVREEVMVRAPTSHVLAAAKADGLRLLREDGWAKVRAGMTTPDEVIRSTAL